MPSYGRAEKGHEVVAGRLIAAGANVDTAMVDTGSTPLLVAAQKGHEFVGGGSADRGRSKQGEDKRRHPAVHRHKAWTRLRCGPAIGKCVNTLGTTYGAPFQTSHETQCHEP